MTRSEKDYKADGRQAIATRVERYGADSLRQAGVAAYRTRVARQGEDAIREKSREAAATWMAGRPKEFFVERARRAAEARRAHQDEHTRRMVEAKRAAGLIAPPIEKVCRCGARFTVPKSRAQITRCQDCITQGRVWCSVSVCGREIAVEPGSRGSHGRRVCADCRAKHKRAEGSAERVAIRCRGVHRISRVVEWTEDTLAGEKRVKIRVRLTLDEPWHAARCVGEVRRRTAELVSSDGATRHVASYDPAAQTYLCLHCSALEKSIAYRVARTGKDRLRGEAPPTTHAGLLALMEAYERERFNEAVALAGAAEKGRRLTEAELRQVSRVKRWAEAQQDPEVRQLAHTRATAPTPESRRATGRRMMAAAWPVAPEGRKQWVDLCPLCERIVMGYGDSDERPHFHDACYRKVLRDAGAREWLERRAKRASELQGRGCTGAMLKYELEKQVPPPWVRSTAGRKREHDLLPRNFAWTVQHYLGYPEPQSQEALARASSVARTSVTQAIDKIISLLPDPEIADKHTRRYVMSLRAAAEARH